MWAIGIAALLPRTASAGPVEQLVQVAMHPSDPNTLIVRYTYGGDGMLRTNDGGKHWQLVCDAMLFDSASNRSGPLAIAGDGTTFMGTFSGLYHDDGHGCGWQSEPKYEGRWMADVAQDPNDPATLYALTATVASDGGYEPNGVVRRGADGLWSEVGARAPIVAERLRVAPHGSGLRFYVSAIRGVIHLDGGMLQPDYVTRVSDDNGQTWTEHEIDIGKGEGIADGTFRIEAVDPTNPDRVIASINREPDSAMIRDADDSVYLSTDQGAHFTEYLKVAEVGGIAFAPDGRIWIGDTGNIGESGPDAPRGLWFANGVGETPIRLPMADYPVQCLGYQDATKTLYACQKFSFGTVATGDGAFTELTGFTSVKDMIACGGVDVPGTCQTQLCNAYCGFGHFAVAPVCAVYDTPSCGLGAVRASGQASDAGSSADAGAALDAGRIATDAGKGIDAGKGTSKRKPSARSSGCGVARAGRTDAAGGVVALALFVALALRRGSRLRPRAR